MEIIGIGGLPRSGKDSLAEIFIDEGYFGVSLGDIVRDESRRRHASEPDPISVANMTETSNYLRGQHGPDFAIKEAVKRFEEAKTRGEIYKGLAVWSVRAPVEADFIIQNQGQLIWVESSDEVRYKRFLQHLREGETQISMEELKAQEALQEKPQPGLPPEVQMNTSYVKAHATRIVENNGNDFESFKTQAKVTLAELL